MKIPSDFYVDELILFFLHTVHIFDNFPHPSDIQHSDSSFMLLIRLLLTLQYAPQYHQVALVGYALLIYFSSFYPITLSKASIIWHNNENYRAKDIDREYWWISKEGISEHRKKVLLLEERQKHLLRPQPKTKAPLCTTKTENQTIK